MRALLGATFLTLLPLVAGCGEGGGRSATHSVRFDIGGFVAYVGEPDVGLGGVAVTLLDADGETYTATTGSSGLWSIDNVPPGVYSERYELAGYDPVTRAFALDAFGENDVSNPFSTRPTVLLSEFPLRATVYPFAVELLDGNDLFDGLGGVSAVYDTSTGDDLTVEFSIPLVGGAYVFLEDGVTSDLVAGTLDTSSGMALTVPGSTIAAMNGGAGLTADTSPQTRHFLHFAGDAVTPIHGEAVSLEATLRFNAVP